MWRIAEGLGQCKMNPNFPVEFANVTSYSAVDPSLIPMEFTSETSYPPMDQNVPMEFTVQQPYYDPAVYAPIMYNFAHVPYVCYPTPTFQIGEPHRLHGQPRDMQRSHQRNVWDEQIHKMSNDEIKKHPFSLPRIKKVMKSNSDVKMVSKDATVLLAKACEFLTIGLTTSSWLSTEECGRKTLSRRDIVHAIHQVSELDFLKNAIQKNE